MEQVIAPIQIGSIPVIRRKETVIPAEPLIEPHQRGGEPKQIGELMEPIQRIMNHPNRNKLMAEFFKRNW